MSSITASVQRDWANREIIEIVQLKILDIVQAVNSFDSTVRVKLSTFHEKLTKLERSLQICESSLDVSSTALKMLQKKEARELKEDQRILLEQQAYEAYEEEMAQEHMPYIGEDDEEQEEEEDA
jgi:hypothetical protein